MVGGAKMLWAAPKRAILNRFNNDASSKRFMWFRKALNHFLQCFFIHPAVKQIIIVFLFHI